jgi:hypothetical protein
LAVESSDSVHHVLKNDEAKAMRDLLEANRQRTPSTAALDAARRAAEIAASDHVSMTRRLQDIDRRIADTERQSPKSWRDLFRGEQRPSLDIEGLRRKRDALSMRQRAGEQHMLNMRAEVARLDRQHSSNVASEAQRQRQALAEANGRLADIQQARRLVVLMPRLAFCRPPYIRSLGARVRRTRLNFGNPDATNIWGLPVNGPGTGNRR